MTTTRTAWCAKCDGPALCDDRGCIACAERREIDRQLRMNAPLGRFCSQCITGTIGLHRAQIEQGGTVYTLCARCDDDSEVKSIELARAWGRRGVGKHGRSLGYAPLDDLLASVRFRILRAIRHFDWVTPERLADALEVPSWDTDKLRRGCFDKAMSRMIEDGHLERIGSPMSFQYRITNLGRAEYDLQIARCAA